MKFVFVVFSKNETHEEILGVFSTQRSAEKYVENFRKNKIDGSDSLSILIFETPFDFVQESLA